MNPSNPRKETEIIEGNRLIAEFMELRLVGDVYMNAPYKTPFVIGLVEELKYHSSWDWLMPVLLKIKDERGIHIWGGYEILPNWKAAVHALAFYKSNPLSAL